MAQKRKSAPRVRRAAGCVAYYRDHAGTLHLLLIRDKQGRWTLPKGHLEAGENEAQAAEREVLEETGVRGTLGPFLGRIAYPMRKRGTLFTKQVAFFLLAAETTELVPQVEEGITGIAWIPASEVLTQAGYDLVGQILGQALTVLEEQTAQ